MAWPPHQLHSIFCHFAAGRFPVPAAGASEAHGSSGSLPTTPTTPRTALTTPRSAGKSGISATRRHTHGDLTAQLGLPTDPPLNKEELNRLDIARCKQVFNQDPDPSWIAFTAAEAQWVPFSVDPRMMRVFREKAPGTEGETEETMMDWICRTETVLHEWIVSAILQSAKRAVCFRSLGRGWIFIQLSSSGERLGANSPRLEQVYKRTRFKWWFEGTERIMRNRSSEFSTSLQLPEDEVDKWLYGYQINSEIVFVTRGMAPSRSNMSRRKLRAEYWKEHIWASSDEIEKEVRLRMCKEYREIPGLDPNCAARPDAGTAASVPSLILTPSLTLTGP